MISWSPSQVKAFKACPRKFTYTTETKVRRNKTQRLRKGEKTQILTKLCGFINRESSGPEAFFDAAAIGHKVRAKVDRGLMRASEEDYIEFSVRGTSYTLKIARRG